MGVTSIAGEGSETGVHTAQRHPSSRGIELDVDRVPPDRHVAADRRHQALDEHGDSDASDDRCQKPQAQRKGCDHRAKTHLAAAPGCEHTAMNRFGVRQLDRQRLRPTGARRCEHGQGDPADWAGENECHAALPRHRRGLLTRSCPGGRERWRPRHGAGSAAARMGYAAAVPATAVLSLVPFWAIYRTVDELVAGSTSQGDAVGPGLGGADSGGGPLRAVRHLPVRIAHSGLRGALRDQHRAGRAPDPCAAAWMFAVHSAVKVFNPNPIDEPPPSRRTHTPRRQPQGSAEATADSDGHSSPPLDMALSRHSACSGPWRR